MIAASQMKVGNYYYFFPEYAQGKKAIWDAIDKAGIPFLKYIPDSLVEAKNGTEMKITLNNGSIIQIIGTNSIDSIMGTNPIGCVFSEYSLQSPMAWDFIRPILAENGGWAVFNGTPRGMNHFWDMHRMSLESPDWFHQRLVACEHPKYNTNGQFEVTNVLNAEDIDREFREGMEESKLRQEYFTDFQASSDNILIPLRLIETSFDRNISYRTATPIAGLDVGLSLTGDPTALVIRQGGKLVHIDEMRSESYEEIAGWAKKHMDEWGCRTICVDGIGWGAGAAQELMKYQYLNVSSINVAERASHTEMFPRLRDELWWKCREWFEEKLCCIPLNGPFRQKLTAELSNVKYSVLPQSNKIKVMSKTEMKKPENGGKSPNIADALCLTFATTPGGFVDSPYAYQDTPQRKPMLL